MLQPMTAWQEYTVLPRGSQTGVGGVDDLFFEKQTWLIRYLVVDTGGRLSEETIVIPPELLQPPDRQSKTLPLQLTQTELESSPDIKAANLFSGRSQTEAGGSSPSPPLEQLGGGLFNEQTFGMTPDAIVETIHAKNLEAQQSSAEAKSGGPRLHSAKELLGYSIEAAGDQVGHVEDFIVNDNSWAIQYMVVDTGYWLPGKKVLISPAWVDRAAWSQAKIQVTLSREAIENSPEYDPTRPITREYESRLYDYYGQPKYWL